MRDNNIIQNAIDCIKKLDKENTELKAETERLKRELSGKRFICPQCMEFAKEIYKYKQTLQEIKAIAENNLCSNCVIHKRECDCRCLADEILQKITKAEEE